ncbi:DC-STAMP domain-containing protein 2 isoform X3 [Accipiter gentilis]|uniref:DC-STAMP domain-containing protein 2 isoform X3 n=1 Tax=Astur gentilis TaxID=8957 RepID=UPI00211017D6|nr:DC-STAMP domain-containing protein 2 isoform X3 [Accipiter gentilis]
MLMLMLALGMAMQGPCTNILHNFSRAAESLSCGAELALNQTAERLQRAQEPLLNMLSKIKDIAQKAKVVGDHVRKFFRSIMDSVSHVGERGSPRVSPSPAPPHPAFSLSLSPLPAACPSTLAPGPQPEPCTMSGCGWRTWAECATTSWARRTAAACASSMRPRTGVSVPSPSSSSSATSSFFSGPFVVWPMVSGSLSLCRRGGKWRGGPIPTTGASPWQRPLLSAVALLFCIIPQYIQSFLKRKIGDPLRDALDRVHREFEFNISAVHRFDISLNASKSLGEVALDIMEGVRLRLEPIRQVLGLFMHVSFCAILYMYLQALRYRHRYLQDDTFDNVYITRRFVELDLWRAEQGKPTVLPLTAWESGRYIAPAGLWLSRQERRQYGLQLVGVLRHVLLGLSIILADYSLFWLLDLVQHQLRGEVVARGEQHPPCRSSTLGCFAGWGPGLCSSSCPFPGTELCTPQRQRCWVSVSMGQATPVRSSGTWSLPSACCSRATSRCSPSAASSSPWSLTTAPTSAWVTGAAAPSACWVAGGGRRGGHPCVTHPLLTRTSVWHLPLHRCLRQLCGTPAPGSVCCLLPMPRAAPSWHGGQGWHVPCAKLSCSVRLTPGKATCSYSLPPGKLPWGVHAWSWSHPNPISTLLGIAKGQRHPRGSAARAKPLLRTPGDGVAPWSINSLPAGCLPLPGWFGSWASSRNAAWPVGRQSSRISSHASHPAAKVGAPLDRGHCPQNFLAPSRAPFSLGLYCTECYQTLNNICSICMGPLSYRDTGDEEMDSSDEDTVGLWLGAVRALQGQEQGRLLQQHIRKVVGGWGGSRRLPPELAARLRAQLKEEASRESDGGSSGMDGEDSSISSLDFSYQEQPESSGSELEEVMALQPPSSQGRAW